MKPVVTAVLALGVALGGTAAGHAAAVPATSGGMQAATQASDPLQLAQVVVKRPGGAAVVRGPARVAPRAVVRPGVAVVRPGVVARPGVVVGRPGFGRPVFVRAYRPWYRRPYFGTIVGGVALGTILTVAAVGIAPEAAPAPGLCWYWADPSMTTGYWDYCQ